MGYAEKRFVVGHGVFRRSLRGSRGGEKSRSFAIGYAGEYLYYILKFIDRFLVEAGRVGGGRSR